MNFKTICITSLCLGLGQCPCAAGTEITPDITNAPMPRITWNPNVEGISQYTIHRGGQSFSVMPDADNHLDWTDTQAHSGTFLVYSLTATNSAGDLVSNAPRLPWRVLSSAANQGVVVYVKIMHGDKIKWQKDNSGRILRSMGQEAEASFLCRSLHDARWLEVRPYLKGSTKLFQVTNIDQNALSAVELSIPHSSQNLYQFITVQANTGSSYIAGQVTGKIRAVNFKKSGKTLTAPFTLSGSYRRQDHPDDHAFIWANGSMQLVSHSSLTDLANSQGADLPSALLVIKAYLLARGYHEQVEPISQKSPLAEPDPPSIHPLIYKIQGTERFVMYAESTALSGTPSGANTPHSSEKHSLSWSGFMVRAEGKRTLLKASMFDGRRFFETINLPDEVPVLSLIGKDLHSKPTKLNFGVVNQVFQLKHSDVGPYFVQGATSAYTLCQSGAFRLETQEPPEFDIFYMENHLVSSNNFLYVGPRWGSRPNETGLDFGWSRSSLKFHLDVNRSAVAHRNGKSATEIIDELQRILIKLGYQQS